MAVTFLSEHLSIGIREPTSIAGRLRPFLARMTTSPLPKKQFWDAAQQLLEARASPQTDEPPPATIQRGSPEPTLASIRRQVADQDAACAARGLRAFLTAYALSNLAGNGARSLTAGALANRRNRGVWRCGVEVPVQEVLRSLSHPVVPADEFDVGQHGSHAFATRAEVDHPLPQHLGCFRFIVGVTNMGPDTTRRSGEFTTYQLTESPEDAHIGLYFREAREDEEAGAGDPLPQAPQIPTTHPQQGEQQWLGDSPVRPY